MLPPLLHRFRLGIAVGSVLLGSITVAAPQDRVDDALAKIAVKVVLPEYPYEARRNRLTGHGVLVAEVDYGSGTVTSVKMEKSTGSRMLDQAALTAFRQWQFKPKTIRQFRTPINYEMASSRAEAMEKTGREQAASKHRSR